MTEIKTKEEALVMRKKSHDSVVFYSFLSFLVLVIALCLDDLKVMVMGILVLILVLYLYIDMRYWDLRYHALK